jgi:threonine dehydrogenase-like Zn-dependent dehydrogenase
MTERRSTGRTHVAKALWYVSAGVVEVRTEVVAAPRTGEVQVQTLYTGISRGTERLVLGGQVGESEWQRMRAPMQAGQFPFPVKYGYCAVGRVYAGPDALMGKTVFCLHPHQDWFNVPTERVTVVPDAVPARRATLTANMETALNALWDSGAGPCDRVVVVGGGIVGLLVAHLAGRIAGADVTLVDVDGARAGLAQRLGVGFAQPADAPGEADVVFHTSASAPGLQTAIGLAGEEAAIVELSWYGAQKVSVELGGPFHSRRLKLVSSQVGKISPSRRIRWDYARRLAGALRLLEDPRLDVLVADEIAFADAVRRVPEVLAPGATGIAPVINFGA